MALDVMTKLRMAMALEWDISKTVAGLGSLRIPGSNGFSTEFTLGSGAGKVDDFYLAKIVVAASGTNNLDLSLALTNLVGSALIAVARIKGIYIRLMSAAQAFPDASLGNACSSIKVGGHATQAWVGLLNATGELTFNNGAGLCFLDPSATGIAVTTGTSDTIKIVNNDASNEARILLGLPIGGT